MGNGEQGTGNEERGTGNGKWEMGNGNGKSKIFEIVVNAELNIFSGYYHIFLKTFCAKLKGIFRC